MKIRIDRNIKSMATPMLLAGILAGCICPANAQTERPGSKPNLAPVQVAANTQPASLGNPASGDLANWHAREGAYLSRKWGVDIVDVRRVASGEMLAFRYIVLDPDKAKVLNDKAHPASLIDEKTGTKLMVPQMEKTGSLRTTGSQKAGRMYWMIFANTGRVVSTGSRVDVNIGDFRVDGLTVVSK